METKMDRKQFAKAIVEIEEALIVASDYFSNRSDVIDGPDGAPEANEEMTALALVEDAFIQIEVLKSMLLKEAAANA